MTSIRALEVRALVNNDQNRPMFDDIIVPIDAIVSVTKTSGLDGRGAFIAFRTGGKVLVSQSYDDLKVVLGASAMPKDESMEAEVLAMESHVRSQSEAEDEDDLTPLLLGGLTPDEDEEPLNEEELAAYLEDLSDDEESN